MKRIICLLFVVPGVGFAAEPLTSCPSGYVAITEDFMTIATSCPSGYVAVGDAESCLGSNLAGSCIMYAPAGMSFTTSAGHTYDFTAACPLE